MKKIYHLSNCTTCQRIIKSMEPLEDIVLQDIKMDSITPEQLEEMASLSGGYEPLFSRRAMLYRQMGLQDKKLSENDYKQLILEHYTFLKRPVILIDDQIFVGNSKKVVEAAQQAIHP